MKPLPWANTWDFRESIENNWWWDDLSNTEKIWNASVDNEDYSRQYRCATDSYFEGNKDLAFERFSSLASHLDGIPRAYVKHEIVSNAINWLGIMHEERGDYQEALKSFELGASRGDFMSFNILNLIRLLIGQSDYKRALAVIKVAKQQIAWSQEGDMDYDYYSHYLVHFLAFEAHRGLGEPEEARKSFLKAISYQLFTDIEEELWNILKVPDKFRDSEFVQIDTITSIVLLGENSGDPECIRIDLIQAMDSYRLSQKDLGKTGLERAKDLVPEILLAITELKWPKGIAESSIEIYFAPDGSKREKRLKIHP
jgi:tetratricopeptide (TPR) repeat protein